MRNIDLNDTIAAIATPIGESGIGIVRISGKDALKIADKVFLSKDKERPSEFKTYTVHYGWVVAGRQKEASEPSVIPVSPGRNRGPSATIIDEVILTVMRAPRSYTKEDVVEINCHGGIVALRRVLDLVLENGCRLAEPGEFTKRAFLNGRIDLAQAEAVLDIIRAKTDSALKIGVEQLRGGLSARVDKIRTDTLHVLSILEAHIDFPEEEIGRADLESISGELNRINNRLKSILDASQYGRILREGIHVVICGRPNVGKSSLLNTLLKQERSIVTPVPGTTRDTIEEVIDIKGIPMRIVDTAGILEPRDLIEKEAIARSKTQISLADLVILLFDGSQRITEEDRILIRKLKKKILLPVVNKIDVRQRIDRGFILKNFSHTIDISAKKGKNINLLEDAIADLVYAGRVTAPESMLVTNIRHIQIIKNAQKLIAEALNSLDNKLSLEFISQDLKDAAGFLDELLGKKFSEDLLDKIFSEFCIGK